MKAVLHFRASPGFNAMLTRRTPDWLDLAIVEETDASGFAAAIADAAVLLHVLEPVTAAMIAAAPRLKLIQKVGVGVNTIDLDAARERGVAVANMPGTNSQAVAEMTLALMFAALRRIPLLDKATRQGAGWSLPVDAMDSCGEIAGRTVGLVGYGAVPQRLAPVLTALGARVIYVNRSEKPDAVGERRPFLDLLAEADIVSLHLPLTAETSGMFDLRAIAHMKPGAVLINTARGGLVDEQALIAALRGRRLAAAGLDTLAIEPAGADNPLFALDNVVVTPHIGYLTPETLSRSLDVAFENCRRVRDGDPLLHQVVP
jgi:phosphoglycerate dehydrogenase-like enzyme